MSRNQNKKNKDIRFSEQLILNSFLLNQLGFSNFQELSDILKNAPEGYDEKNISHFYNVFIESTFFINSKINKDVLLDYDGRIYNHTRQMQGRRDNPISWKYFQWACLIFVEIYLDKYFTDKENFIKELNDYKNDTTNEKYENWKDIKDYTLEDLNKIALWNATGSGKTLLMHVNYFQYRFYLEKYNKQNSINNILLITPNEGLSNQHYDNFQESNIDCEKFNKNNSTNTFKNIVEIIEITKLRNDGKEKTVSTESFEENNLVFIDEVHKGTGGDVWKEQRDKLYKKGFAFEYSATLGQAVESANEEDLQEEYAKTTLFDYSYTWFYKDGYGKDYRIFNLEDDKNKDFYDKYLIGSLLSYYQQLLLWQDENNKKEIYDFNIQKPLWVFVGATVSKTKTKSIEKNIFPDVVRIVKFFNDFISNKQDSINLLNKLREPLLDKNGKDIFSNSFNFIIDGGLYGEDLFNKILNKVFNTSSQGKLHLKILKGSNGEISLSVGDNEPFGLINVGKVDDLIKCFNNTIDIIISNENFMGSMFNSIKQNNSDINILIGSKKFTEGWDCFRVSTIGLMNVGKSEGSEIIQLFGRGVRLKGYNNKLKRLKYIDINKLSKLTFNQKNIIQLLETINVFGVKADYMEQFKKDLQKEGLPTGSHEMKEFPIPIIKSIPKDKKLKTIRLKSEADFKKQSKSIDIKYDEYLQKNKIILDWYPKVQSIQSSQAQGGNRLADKEKGKLSYRQLSFIDWQKIYFDLQDYKAQKSKYNTNLSIDNIKMLFDKNDWYDLYIPKTSLEVCKISDYLKFYDIVLSLLKKYFDRYYLYKKTEWEKDKLEYQELSVEDNNFGMENYLVYVDENQIDLIKQINNVIKNNKFDWNIDKLSSLYFDKHLYNPILILENSSDIIEVKPIALNKGEGQFVKDLRDFYTFNKDKFKNEDIYLLRNKSRKGIGFFEEGGFYPDFIMWHIKGNKQYITFIDPKGIRNLDGGQTNHKLNFYEKIKEIEQQLNDSNIKLNSVIVSVTPIEEVPWKNSWFEKDFNNRNCFFQNDSNYIQKIFELNK